MADTPEPVDPIDRAAKWKSRVSRAIETRKTHETAWQKNLDAYRGTPLSSQPEGDWVNVNKDFANVEQKKALLFFQSPNVQLTPTEVMAGKEQAVELHEAVLDQKLGPHGVDAKRLMDRVLFDVLCPSGLGATKIGYDRVLVTVERPVLKPMLDPLTGMPAVDPTTGQPGQVPQLDGAGQPVMEPVEVPIFEECYWRHFSPKRLLIPHDWHGSNYDDAPWLGMQFVLPKRQAPQEWHLPDDLGSGSVDEKDLRFDHGESGGAKVEEHLIAGCEIWYKAALYDDDVRHPQVLRQLVLIDGMDEPAVWKDSADQTVGPDGRLSPDSLIGFPIHILTIRDLADSAYPPSDCSVTRALIDELCKFRTQLVLQRDRSLPMRGFDLNAVTPDTAAKLERGEYQSMIPMDGPFQDRIWEIARATYPRENFAGQDYIQRDIQEALAISANQLGQQQQSETTATEVQAIQSASNVRMDAERLRVLTWFANGVGKLDALLQRYMTTAQYIQYLGPQGQQVEQLWDRTAISGRFAYTIKPDSAVHVDADQRRRQVMQLYNFLRKDPVVNPTELVSLVAREWDLSPEKILAQPQPPGPPPPNVNVRVTMEDFIGPAGPIALKVLQQAGYQLTAQDLAQVQQNNLMRMNAEVQAAQVNATVEHGGPADKAELLNKRQAEETGGMQGMAAPPGMVQ